MDSCMYMNLVHRKGGNTNHWGNKRSFNKVELGRLAYYEEKIKLDTFQAYTE